MVHSDFEVVAKYYLLHQGLHHLCLPDEGHEVVSDVGDDVPLRVLGFDLVFLIRLVCLLRRRDRTFLVLLGVYFSPMLKPSDSEPELALLS